MSYSRPPSAGLIGVPSLSTRYGIGLLLLLLLTIAGTAHAQNCNWGNVPEWVGTYTLTGSGSGVNSSFQTVTVSENLSATVNLKFGNVACDPMAPMQWNGVDISSQGSAGDKVTQLSYFDMVTGSGNNILDGQPGAFTAFLLIDPFNNTWNLNVSFNITGNECSNALPGGSSGCIPVSQYSIGPLTNLGMSTPLLPLPATVQKLSGTTTFMAQALGFDAAGVMITWTFTWSISPAEFTVVIDPGHGQILKGGVLTYQRPPSPTFGLREDNLTLTMSTSATQRLPKVYLTRIGKLAPYAPANCNVPCFIDIAKRRQYAEKLEANVLVSVHTNASPSPKDHGTEAYYRPDGDKSPALSSDLLDSIVSLGISRRKVNAKGFNILSDQFPSSLVEVAFHSNSQLAPGQSITDETRLNQNPFLVSAGTGIADAINLFLFDTFAGGH